MKLRQSWAFKLGPMQIGPGLTLAAALCLAFVPGAARLAESPPAVLIVFVVYSSLGGARPGMLSAIIASAYFAWFFSDHTIPLQYSAARVGPVIAWALATPATVILVARLHGEVERAKQAQFRELEQKFLHDACHDALTGLANRAVLMDRLAQCLRRSKKRGNRPFALLFLDLDRFKLVNDSLGHVLGDQLLIEMARRLESCIRPGDTVCRLGGDEFTVLLEDVSGESDALHIAKRIQDSLSEPMRLGGQEVFPTTSIGIALSRETYSTPEDIMRDADVAMYRAKAVGPARTEVFDSAMHESALAVLQTETDLRWAVERREFRVFYQPIVSLRTGTLYGFEALVRWQHPLRGLLAPGDFIQVAEEAGIVIEIDRWVLRTACRQLTVWQAAIPEALHLSINVNLSAKQFAHVNIVDEVESALRETGLARSYLNLELTESAFMENNGEAKLALKKLSEMGASLYLDDFGTGYSSLGYLHRFPINAVKIDKTFIAGMQPSGEGQELVRAIITMTHALKMRVIAEGVETDVQATQLRDLGCDFAQGYHFGRPVDAREAEIMVIKAPRWLSGASFSS